MYHIKILIQNFIIIYFFVHVVWLSKRFTTPYINLRTYLNQQRNKKNKEKVIKFIIKTSENILNKDKKSNKRVLIQIEKIIINQLGKYSKSRTIIFRDYSKTFPIFDYYEILTL